MKLRPPLCVKFYFLSAYQQPLFLVLYFNLADKEYLSYDYSKNGINCLDGNIWLVIEGKMWIYVEGEGKWQASEMLQKKRE